LALVHGLDEAEHRREHIAIHQDREQQLLEGIRQNPEQDMSLMM
jgi:hypothetical protein